MVAVKKSTALSILNIIFWSRWAKIFSMRRSLESQVLLQISYILFSVAFSVMLETILNYASNFYYMDLLAGA